MRFAEGLEASHPGFGATAGVVICTPLPEYAAVVTRGAQVFVARLGGGAVLLLRSAILSDGDDSRDAACDDST
jgi:hypothetical protein